MAPRSMPRVRRGRDVLGAGGDGPDERRASWRARSRPRPCRSSARPWSSAIPDPEERRWVEPRLASLLGLENGTAPRPRRPVRRVAAVLRAAGRGDADRHGVRGPPVGRRRAARLHRVPAGVVAEPSPLRPHAGSTRAAGAPTGLGHREAELDLDPSGAAPAERDGRAARRAGARAARASCRDRVLDRAEGVPLYAVETVRMLLDRGLLAAGGRRYSDRPGRSRSSRFPRPSTG